MKIKLLFIYLGIFLSISAYADAGLTQEDVELFKSACLVGDSYQFSTKADGSISIKNLEGKGELSVSRRNVDTVDLPDADKREEFKEIRQCIKEYIKDYIKPPPPSQPLQPLPPWSATTCKTNSAKGSGSCALTVPTKKGSICFCDDSDFGQVTGKAE